MRNAFGDCPVPRLKKREKYVGSENPRLSDTWFTVVAV